jgi:phosphoribosylformimino-5-aminoimidazole carboxamide ribotide isomerase
VRVVGVIDLRDGRAVRAYAGARDQYQPIGDAVDLARRYVAHYKLTELYVADLDAIESTRLEVARPFQGREAGGPQRRALLIRQIAGLGVPVWLDAGVSSVDHARHALDLGATHVVVGLETLLSFEALHEICSAIGGEHVAFSLDLRSGVPIAGARIPREKPEQLVVRAADAGVGSIIVIDLARVGTRTGIDFDLLGRIRTAARGLTLLTGGGVGGPRDLERLADLGCDGALVATALDALYPSSTR